MTPEEKWKLDKRGMFSASEMFKLLPGKKRTENVFDIGAMTYIEQMATDSFTEYEAREINSYAMANGKAEEPKAVVHYGKLLGIHPTYYGDGNPTFFKYCSDSGCSPDAVLFKPDGNISFGAEFKCPERLTHSRYLRKIKNDWDLKDQMEEYYCQCQFAMMVFKCDLWHWCSYNDYFPFSTKLHIIEVKANVNFQRNLDARLKLAIAEKRRIVEELNQYIIP